MNHNNKMSFLEFVLHDNKAVSFLALLLAVGMPIYWSNQQGEGDYLENTAFWLWIFFGLVLPMFILGYVIRAYRDYLNGKSR